MNRSIQMYEYRQVILQMRLGESDRAIAKSGLVSRTKAGQIRAVVEKEKWLDASIELPTDETLSPFFNKRIPRTQSESFAKPFVDEITQWVAQGIQATTIHQTLKTKYGFSGQYDSVNQHPN